MIDPSHETPDYQILTNIVFQLQHLFNDEVRKPRSVIDALILHGSVLDQHAWMAGSRPRDIDMLIIQPSLSYKALVQLYSDLRSMVIADRPVVIDPRIGPLDTVCAASGDEVVIQLAVYRSFSDVSPATLNLLAFGGKAVIGRLPSLDVLKGYGDETLNHWLKRDLADIRTIAVNRAIPYWHLSDDPAPRQVAAVLIPQRQAEILKARRYARNKLFSWSMIMHFLGACRLCGLGADDLLELARAFDEEGDIDSTLAALNIDTP